jgi:hypothetical protein
MTAKNILDFLNTMKKQKKRREEKRRREEKDEYKTIKKKQ